MSVFPRPSSRLCDDKEWSTQHKKLLRKCQGRPSRKWILPIVEHLVLPTSVAVGFLYASVSALVDGVYPLPDLIYGGNSGGISVSLQPIAFGGSIVCSVFFAFVFLLPLVLLLRELKKKRSK